MDQLHDYCGRCGRKLKNEKSKILGFGRCCYKKYKAEIAKADYEKRQGKLLGQTA